MKLPGIGLLLLLALAIPPVAHLMESIMVIHMHMQMPMLVIAGFFMAPAVTRRFPRFFEQWNGNGVPGIFLFIIIVAYWTLPRAMDEALTLPSMELFKFISLPFLAGIPLRDSWKKLNPGWKNSLFLFFTVKYFGMGLLYIYAPIQLCNNYLVIEQLTLGWSFILTAICIAIYLIYTMMVDRSAYE